LSKLVLLSIKITAAAGFIVLIHYLLTHGFISGEEAYFVLLLSVAICFFVLEYKVEKLRKKLEDLSDAVALVNKS